MLSIALASALIVLDAQPPADPAAAILEEMVPADGPGCVAGTAAGGGEARIVARGLASVELGVPLARDSRFDIASNAKQFTAAIGFLLVRDGRLDLDAPIQRYLVDFPAYRQTIRVRDLLQHSSGLRDFDSLRMLTRTEDETTPMSEDVETVIRRQRGLNFDPGTRFAYSNSNYFLLARILESVSGKPFGEIFQERIAQPFALADTGQKTNYAQLVPRRASPYVGSGTETRLAATNWTAIGGSSIISSVPDALRWLNRLMGDRELLAAMTAPGRLSDGSETRYGGGLVIDRSRSPARYFHNGGSAGYRSSYQFYPERRLAVVVMCNSGSLFPNRIAERIGDAMLGRTSAGRAGGGGDLPPGLRAGLYRNATGDGYRWIELAPGAVTVKISPRDPGRTYRLLAGGHLLEESQGLRGRIAGGALMLEDNLLYPERFVPASPAEAAGEPETGHYGSEEIETRFSIGRDAEGLFASIEPVEPFMRASDTISRRLTRIADGAFVSDNGWIVRPAGPGRIELTIGRLIRFPLARLTP